MNKPNLDRVYETFIPIMRPHEFQEIGTCEFVKRYMRILRDKVKPLIRKLEDNKIIAWYGFHIHDRNSGVPTSLDDDTFYIHIRLELQERIALEQLENILPDYCKMTRKCPHLNGITGIKSDILREGQIKEAWWIIGETSSWILKMLNAHSETADIDFNQLKQFLHFFENSLGLG